jgi:malate dehydrogenase
MNKITVIGAGNVGATCANVIAHKNLAKEVVLVDVKEGLAEGKCLDILQSGSINNYNTLITGTSNDYFKTAGSGIIVITSGVPRKPGMSRDDLIKINAVIVKEVTEKVMVYSPDAVVVVVSNPLDVMTYAAYKAARTATNKVMGMAGILDAARFKAFISEALNVSQLDVTTMILGGHGDTMVPLPRFTSVSGIPITDLLSHDTIAKIVNRTRHGGGEIVNLMGTSAWYAPGAAAAQMVEAIVNDQKRVFPVCALCNGEYGLNDVFVGVPVKLGKDGIEQIIELKLNNEEMEMLNHSAKAVKEQMNELDKMNLFQTDYSFSNISSIILG